MLRLKNKWKLDNISTEDSAFGVHLFDLKSGYGYGYKIGMIKRFKTHEISKISLV